MSKIKHDKYYSPQHIVDLVIERTKEVIGLDDGTCLVNINLEECNNE